MPHPPKKCPSPNFFRPHDRVAYGACTITIQMVLLVQSALLVDSVLLTQSALLVQIFLLIQGFFFSAIQPEQNLITIVTDFSVNKSGIKI